MTEDIAIGQKFFGLDESPPLGIRVISAENHDRGPLCFQENFCE